MKRKDGFVSIVKGFITGIASLIPGVSPASCFVSLSSYEKFITGLSTIFSKKTNKKEKINNKQILLLVTIPIILGLLLGLVAGNHLISYFLGKYKVQTVFLFIGILVGGLVLIFKKKQITPTKKTILVFIISLILFFALYIFLNNYNITIPKFLYPILAGFLTSLTVIVPCISASYIYNILDKYNYIINSLSSLSNIKNILIVIVFIATLVLTLILIAKLISYLIKKHKEKCYSIISALIILNIIIMILKIDKFTISFVNIFTTILAFLWGYLLAKNIEKE